MKVVEVGVRNQHRVDRRQLPQLQSGPAQPLENKNPPREVGINQDVLAPDLEEEAGMSDEGYAQLARDGRVQACAGSPVRGVRAECRTKVPNCLALRRIVIPNMEVVSY